MSAGRLGGGACVRLCLRLCLRRDLQKRVEDDVDFTAGVWLHKKVGEAVEAGDTLCTLHTSVAAVRVCRVPTRLTCWITGCNR